ncbi:MAG TPA: hypothetical protein VFZ71_12460, partial [Pyrinomonadaceae bacterium]
IAVGTQQDRSKAPSVTAQKEKEIEQRQEFERRTLALLNEVASAAWSLKLPENRIFVMTSAAELLWGFDEKRARNLYWEAINSLNLVVPPARRASESLSKEERLKIQQALVAVYELRRNTLRRVARRDPQLAFEMLRATRQVVLRESKSQFFPPDDRQLEQDIAREVAAHDPARALQLARESLAKGFTLELLNLIGQLTQKDPEKASEFAGDVISKLRMTNVAADFRASTIAVRLLQYSRMPDPTVPGASLRSTPQMIRLTDDQRRDLVEVVTNAALNASANSNLLFDVSRVMPEIQQFFPERRAPLEQKRAAFDATLSKEQRHENTLNDLVRRGIPEEIVRGAASESEGTRLALYRQAAISAVARGTTESFRDLVSKEIKDEDEQRKVIDLLDAEQISLAARHKKIDELRELLPKIRLKEERARAMIAMALILKENGEDAEAAALLDEAAPLIKANLSSESQTNALLSLLAAYALIDPPKAFALAERTVDQANDQISLLMLLDRVVKSGAVKKSEIILDQAGIMPLDILVFRYGKGVAALAKVDFGRTRALADRFERPELRLMARLMIVKGILNPEADKNLCC